jgi:predicted heme/steroid binding protein/uncharacterized membrane protein
MLGREMRDKQPRHFNISELNEYDGKEGRPVYIAYKGKVYDVTDSKFWKNGVHSGLHSAGIDLTKSIVNAPHDEEKFKRFRIVGKLSEKDMSRKKLVNRLKRMHPHPILVHFPIAYSITIPLLSFIYLFSHKAAFEIASYFMLTLGLLTGPISAISGFFSWKVKFEGRLTKTFVMKIRYSIIFTVIIATCFAWRTLNPELLLTRTTLSYIYLILEISLIPLIMILGHYGGKIVYS